jgi:hypothetical protein
LIRAFSVAKRAGEEGVYTRRSLFGLDVVLLSAAAINEFEEEEEGKGIVLEGVIVCGRDSHVWTVERGLGGSKAFAMAVTDQPTL